MLLELLSHTVLQDSRFRTGQDLRLGGSLPPASLFLGVRVGNSSFLSVLRRWVSAPPLQSGKAVVLDREKEKYSLHAHSFTYYM